jgi:hypothetical protein
LPETVSREKFPFHLKEVEQLDIYHDVKEISRECIQHRPPNDHYTLLLKKIIKVLKSLEIEKIHSLKSRLEELKGYFDELRAILGHKKASLEIDLDLCRYADDLVEKSEREPLLKKAVLKRLYRYSKGLLPVYDDDRLERTNNTHEFVNNRIKTKRRRISGKMQGRLRLEFHGPHDAIKLNFKGLEDDFPGFLEMLRKYGSSLSEAQFLELKDQLMKLREPHRKLLRLRRESFEVIKKRIESILIPPEGNQIHEKRCIS